MKKGDFQAALLWHMKQHRTKITDLAAGSGVSADLIKKLRTRPGGSTSAEAASSLASFYGKSVTQFVNLDDAHDTTATATALGLPFGVEPSAGPSPTTETLCGIRVSDGQLPYKEIGNRLRRVREAFSDLNQTEWAEKNRFNKTQYNNWETGARRIPIESAEELCDRYGLTLDAIYRGRLDGLSFNIMKLF